MACPVTIIDERGEAEQSLPKLSCITADNSGPTTFEGTNTYLLIAGDAVVVDPGPMSPAHVTRIEQAVSGKRVSGIVLTHRHRDHSEALVYLQQRTRAKVYAFGANPIPVINPDGTSGTCLPDVALCDGDVVSGNGWRLEAIHTPGHSSDHICLALPQLGVLLTGDHVMGWATTTVTPPDGSMKAYLASLERLTTRRERIFYSGHGPSIDDPQSRITELLKRRRRRAEEIVARIKAGDETVEMLLQSLYGRLVPALRNSARNTISAHLIALQADGRLVLSSSEPVVIKLLDQDDFRN